MAKIPDQHALGRPRYTSPRMVPHFDASAAAAPGKALASLGNAISSLSGAFGAMDKEAEANEQHKNAISFLDFDLKQEDKFIAAQRAAKEDGTGFREETVKSYDADAREWFKGVSEKERPKYDLMLRRRALDFERRARSFELDRHDSYQNKQVDTMLNDFRGRVQGDPDNKDEWIGRGNFLIDQSKLSADKKAQLRSRWASEAEQLAIESRVNRGDDPEEIKKDLYVRPSREFTDPQAPGGNSDPGGLNVPGSKARTPGPQSGVDARTFLRSKLAKGYEGRTSDVDNLHPVMQDRLAALTAAAQEEGHDIRIVSGHRSAERQAVLWQNALKKYGSAAEARKNVAPPGGSSHQSGEAVDLQYGDRGAGLGGKRTAAVEWAHKNAARFGLSFPLGHEDWHIEPIEARAGGKRYGGEYDTSKTYFKGAASAAKADSAADDDIGAPRGTPPETLAAVKSVASTIGADPRAIGAVIEVESNWNKNTRTGSYRGLTQVGPVTLAEMGVSSEQYDKMSQAEQTAFYGRWLGHYKFSDKMQAAGIDIKSLPPARQAAMLQAFQFAPNGAWVRRFADGDTKTPVTNTKQARALGSTSIDDMERYFASKGLGQEVAAAPAKDDAAPPPVAQRGPTRVASLDPSAGIPQQEESATGAAQQKPPLLKDIIGDERYRAVWGANAGERSGPQKPWREALTPSEVAKIEKADPSVKDGPVTLDDLASHFYDRAMAKPADAESRTVDASGKSGSLPALEVQGQEVSRVTGRGQIATLLDGIPDDRPLSSLPDDVRDQVMAALPRDVEKERRLPDGQKAAPADFITVGEAKRAFTAPVQSQRNVGLQWQYRPDAKYRHLSEADRRKMIHKLEIAQREYYLEQAEGEAEYVEKYGKEKVDKSGRTLVERARSVFMPNQLKKLELKIQRAKWHHDIVSPIANMSDDEIKAHIARTEPTEADAADLTIYAAKQKAWEAATLRRDKVIKLRESDGALASESAPEVKAARAQIEIAKRSGPRDVWVGQDKNGPSVAGRTIPTMTQTEAMESLIDARIEAQQKWAGDFNSRRVRSITKEEAHKLLGGGRWSEMAEDEQSARLEALAKTVDARYGKHARKVFDDAVALVVTGKSSKEEAGGLMQKYVRGEPITASDLQSYRMMRMTDGPLSFIDAGRASDTSTARPAIMDAAAPIKPPGAAIQWLMADPQKRAQVFDQQFGTGATQRVVTEMMMQKAPAGMSLPMQVQGPPAQKKAPPAPSWLMNLFGSKAEPATP